jgi:hypothetical protein
MTGYVITHEGQQFASVGPTVWSTMDATGTIGASAAGYGQSPNTRTQRLSARGNEGQSELVAPSQKPNKTASLQTTARQCRTLGNKSSQINDLFSQQGPSFSQDVFQQVLGIAQSFPKAQNDQKHRNRRFPLCFNNLGAPTRKFSRAPVYVIAGREFSVRHPCET